MTLTERAKQVLCAAVTEFIETGEAVASRTLATKYKLDVSSATIRNVFVDLEEAGYLFQPHTSAGRVPTDRAFRLFVDELMVPGRLSLQEAQSLHALDQMEPGAALLQESGRILSALAGMASLILAPQADRRRLDQMHFVITRGALHPLLAVMLFADGTVETRFVDVPQPPDEQQLEAVHNVLSEMVHGKTLQEVRDELARALDRDRLLLNQLKKQAYELGYRATEPAAQQRRLVIEGRARLLEQPEFEDAEKLRELMRALEERERLVVLLDGTLRASTVQVLVGSETGNLAKASISLVVAPYTNADATVGTIGVLGPTRMNYAKVVPLVSATANAVSKAHQRAAGKLQSDAARRKRRKKSFP